MRQFRIRKLFLFFSRKVKNFSYRKAVVFVVCLALSSLLWLLNSLEKRYTSRITVPVHYVEMPKDRQLSGPLPSSFDLLVDANGYTLLIYKFRLAFSPVLINVSDFVDIVYDRSRKNRYAVSTALHKEEIEKQISGEIKILTIKPDSLVFNFSKIITRKIRVRPLVNCQLKNQYSLEKEPSAAPDSVVASGPRNILDTLRSIPAGPVDLKNVSGSMEVKVGLQVPPGLTTDIREVKVFIPVEQNTEVNFEVPVQVINKPSDVVLKIFPGKVKVSCRIGLSKYRQLDYNQFRATINYERITPQEPRIPVIFEYPSARNYAVAYSPREVEYILERK